MKNGHISYTTWATVQTITYEISEGREEGIYFEHGAITRLLLNFHYYCCAVTPQHGLILHSDWSETLTVDTLITLYYYVCNNNLHKDFYGRYSTEKKKKGLLVW